MPAIKFNFAPLETAHFPLLIKWLQTPHVKNWWDQEIEWTIPLIEEKYGDYITGYKLINGQKKPLKAFIIELNKNKLGYIQFYNAHDFPREDGLTLDELPPSLAAFDIYIGDASYIGKGYGTLIMEQFLKDYIDPYFEACFVDPNLKNKAAIRAYEKVGFKPFKTTQDSIWLIRKRKK